MSTCLGPVSARQNDREALNMSGLVCLLVLIQAHFPPHVWFMLFGDSIFRGNLQMIMSYFHVILPDVLTLSKLKCNAALRAARMPIEKTMTSKAVLWEYVILDKDLAVAPNVLTTSSNWKSATYWSTATYVSMVTMPVEKICLRILRQALMSISASSKWLFELKLNNYLRMYELFWNEYVLFIVNYYLNWIWMITLECIRKFQMSMCHSK